MKRVSHSIIISILFCNLKACGVSFYSGAIITPPRAKCRTGKLALRCETDIINLSLCALWFARHECHSRREKPQNHSSKTAVVVVGALCAHYNRKYKKKSVSFSERCDIRHRAQHRLSDAKQWTVLSYFFASPGASNNSES
jgi:hypothetical protein